jgi:hypothetical protein
MAMPGYPPQMGPGGHMPQMQPMMGMPMGRPIRRGTSRAVPVVVSAGLAVGVFCGLLFGLGTEKSEASNEPAKGNNVKAGGESTGATAGAAPEGLGATSATPTPTTGGAAGPTSIVSTNGKNPVAIASGARSGGTTTAAGGAVPAAPGMIKLTIEIDPAEAASAAKIVVDGKEITGKSVDVAADKKQVKVAITAPGFHSVDKKVDIQPGADTSLKLEMQKRSSGGGTASPGFGGASNGQNHVPKEPPKLKKPPTNNGIIDI